MNFITKKEFDACPCTHIRPDGAQAKIVISQRTHGMMMGSKYAVLVIVPRTAVEDYLGSPDTHAMAYRVGNFGRGESAYERGEAWLASNGFVPK